ncbi:putative lipid II flippase FtsW [uncultured Modestobacter sp.]|uniref:putative lipid II flippase FtsW n=1 Tax=uncultured Modestobacter sp. TaxID=380048 RepID=UPI00261E4746|nr:putative lipid II flippase FtsW [uncultured Modestobacter sp.]
MATTTRERRAVPARPPEPATTPRTGLTARFRGPAWLDGPMTSAHLVLGSAGMLLAIGLVMVFSASSIEAATSGQPAWLPGVRQLTFAVIGLAGMLVAMRLPVGRIRQWSGRGMLVVFLLLALVLIPGIGIKLNGSRAWFDLGFTNFQPSELAKLVFALWGAHVLALRERYLTTRTLLVPVIPVFVLMCLLLIAEPDMGAVVSLGLVVAGLMWAGGLSRRYLAGAVAVVAALVALMVAVAPYRMARVTSFLDPFADPLGDGMQAIRGFYALATGGVWGVGLGNSALKWNLLPHAESDYIFAIIGEELGFLGCLVVIALYGMLAWAGFRIARRSTDRFVQLASIAITVWLVGQATMNMGYVVGLLPVTGVTLPLISAGGTSLVLTLFVIGLLARFARSEPAAIAHQRHARRGWLARLLLPVPAAAVDPVPARRRRPARPDRDQGRSWAPGQGWAAGQGWGQGRRPEPVREPDRWRPGRTVTRVPGLRTQEQLAVQPGSREPRPDPRRAAPGPGSAAPDARRGAVQRQTGRGRLPAGDRPIVRNRPPAAGPVLRDVPRDPGGPGEPPAARARPVARPRPPRTERPRPL